MQIDFPTIKTFIAGNFHQNWIDFADDEDSVITQMLLVAQKIGSRSYVSDLRAEVEQLLSLHLDETILRDLLKKRYRCNCDPHLDGSTWRLWLEHLRDRLDEHLKFSL